MEGAVCTVIVPLWHSLERNKNMADLISDTSATRCVTLIAVKFLKNENNNMSVVPDFFGLSI
jgi:hypothetical protein